MHTKSTIVHNVYIYYMPAPNDLLDGFCHSCTKCVCAARSDGMSQRDRVAPVPQRPMTHDGPFVTFLLSEYAKRCY